MKKLLNSITDYRFTPWIIAGLVLAGYALSVPAMGFFMDDWYLIWYKHIFGALQYPTYFSVDRPLMGYFYVAANFLLGNTESAFLWQAFGLFMRWLCVFALWGFLNTLWPNARRQNTLVVLLASVFPGFTQQWIAIIYSFFFFCLACFFLSLTLMLKAVRTPRRFWLYVALSLITGVYAYAAAEFYFGLELIRPVVLWIEYARIVPTFKERLWKTLKTAIPFMIAYLIYGVWRAFFFVSVNHGVAITDRIKASPLSVLGDLVQRIYQAGVDGLVNAWVNPLNLENYPAKGIVPFAILGLVLVVFGIVSVWLLATAKKVPEGSETGEKSWTREAFWLGIISMIVAIIPFWAADLPVDYLYPYDRFLLAYLFGSCLVLVALLDHRKKGLLLAAFLVAVSVGYQFNLGIRYKNSWEQQRDFFWQLTWRAPAIEPGTLLITEDLPFSKYYSGPSLTAPLNMIYAPDLDSHEIPYLLVLQSQQKEIVKTYEPDQPVAYDFRSFVYTGSTSNVLVFKKPAEGCLRLVTAEDVAEDYGKKGTLEFWQAAIPATNLGRIIAESQSVVEMPERFFGSENRDQWCYYFEKADLARQDENWQETIRQYEEAQEAGFAPSLNSEWGPLIEAYLQTSDYDRALQITQSIDLQRTEENAGICRLWEDARDKDANLTQPLDALNWLKCDQ